MIAVLVIMEFLKMNIDQTLTHLLWVFKWLGSTGITGENLLNI